MAVIIFDNWYLPFADKLMNVRQMYLRRSTDSTDNNIKDPIAFIVKNRLAFPQKRPVRVDFDFHGYRPPPRNMSLEERREFDRKKHRSRIELYNAIAEPSHMDASIIPYSYDDIIDGPELDSLETFVDIDSFQRKYGESSSQKMFLQQCHNLKSLDMPIIDPNLFKWAVKGQHPATQRQKSCHWNKLKSLNLVLFTDAHGAAE
ncbi:hypothetical protein BG003_011606 [Podila horticola]|nr:hypothetical protein BG003_011606 [Podila horticola]